ncbi:DUF2953 domain-containing protein [Alloiococcus sp. CFN-8]|uniref:DUF2953 domain-containing protein n=1 Tax=Alloiococcus sp. CFN-8 TaxID=3416081 RepID=UPI003CEEFAC6
MLNISIILVSLVTILFFPINLILNLEYNKSLDIQLSIAVYKYKVITLYPPKKPFKNKLHKSKRVEHKFSKFLKILTSLSKNQSKPSLYTDLKVSYQCEETAETALIYGLFSSVPPLFYGYMKDYFNIKSYTFTILPTSDDVIHFNFSLNSIIKANIGKIIRVFMLFKKHWR